MAKSAAAEKAPTSMVKKSSAVKKPAAESPKTGDRPVKSRRAPAGGRPFVVGIGASAGGLEALRPLVAKLPLKADMAYVIAQHLSPQHRSMMVQLLGRETELPVVEVKDRAKIVPNVIFMAPPNSDVFVKGGVLRLRKPLEPLGPKPSVDYLFTSLAENVGERAIGIILSGTGSDGAHGVRAIKAAGGVTIAQEPESAKYNSMPKAAINLGGADIALRPEEIAEHLLAITTTGRGVRGKLDRAKGKGTVNWLADIIGRIRQQTGIDFSSYKENTIQRQISRRMAALQIRDVNAYLDLVTRTPTELEAVAKNFLISVTSFFRDQDAFAGAERVLDGILATKQPGDDIRMWIPGCATGEEAYSFAILIAEKLGPRLGQFRVQVFGTDIDGEATVHARRGEYPEAAVADLGRDILRRYFIPSGRLFRVNKVIRDMVVFARHDVVQDPPFLRVDMISCRNLLIYFKPELQEQVMRMFHYALRPHGHLFLGKSETVGNSRDLFSTIDSKLKVFRRKDLTTAHPLHLMRPSGHYGQHNGQSRGTAAAMLSESDPAQIGRALLLSRYAPDSMLVTRDGDILHFFGDANPYIKIGLSGGKADFKVLSIVHPDLRAELRALIHRTSRSNESSFGMLHKLASAAGERFVRVAVHPVDNTPDEDAPLLVSFEEKDPPLSSGQADSSDNLDAASMQIVELEQELKSTKENLQTVVEELETSNEELQSVNEELQASNEELQASNEELETSNEELQATNEELTTVNDELSAKSQQLHIALAELESVVNSSDQAIVVVDTDFQIIRHNDRALNLFHFDAGSRANLLSIDGPFDPATLRRPLLDAVRHGTTWMGEVRAGKRHYLVQVAATRIEGHGISGAVLNFSDLTVVRAAEREVMAQAERARLMLETAGDGIVFTASDGTVHAMNEAARHLFGLKSANVIGQPIRDLIGQTAAGDKNLDHLARYLAFEGRRAQKTRFDFRLDRGGATRHFSAALNHFQQDGTTYRGATLRDVTEVQQAQAAMHEAKLAAESANRAKSNFLAKMSHELRTPLNAIIGFSEAMLGNIHGPLGSPYYQGYADDIFQSGHHLLQVVNDVLDLSKVEADKLELFDQEMRVVDVVKAATALIAPLATKAKVALVSRIPGDLPMIVADDLRIRQVLVNLLGNAVKFSDPGDTVTVQAGLCKDGGLFIEIVDHGIGMSAADIQKALSEYGQVVSAARARKQGSGLGLPVSRALMESHGGALMIESAPGKGTTARVILPTSRVRG